MITIEENYTNDEIDMFVSGEVFDKQVLYNTSSIIIIKWLDPTRIAVYIPKNKEKDLSELPSDLQNIITKERL